MARQNERKPPRVSVVILNWNGKSLLGPCLDSMQKQEYRDFEIVVADNGSSDGSLELVRAHYPHVRIVDNGANLGFTDGNNKAMATCDGEFIALLNNDTVAQKDWLQQLVAAADASPSTCSSFASRMMLVDRPDVVNSAGIMLLKDGGGRDRFAFVPLAEVMRARGDGTADATQEAGTGLASGDVAGACGGAALFRREALEAVRDGKDGYLESSFFMYFEDVDLAYRLLWAGYSARYVHEAVVFHHGSASAKKITHKRIELGQLNRLRVMARDFTARMLLMNLPWIVARQLLEFFYFTIRYASLAPLVARLRFLPEILKWRAWHGQMRRHFGRDEKAVSRWLQSPDFFEAYEKRAKNKF